MIKSFTNTHRDAQTRAGLASKPSVDSCSHSRIYHRSFLWACRHPVRVPSLRTLQSPFGFPRQKSHSSVSCFSLIIFFRMVMGYIVPYPQKGHTEALPQVPMGMTLFRHSFRQEEVITNGYSPCGKGQGYTVWRQKLSMKVALGRWRQRSE